MQVVHSYCYTFSSLSGKEYYNQHYNVTSFSLNIVFTYMYFKIITLVGKRNLQSRAMSSYPSCCAVCLSHPFSPFPVKSCKKFKADEVYCWRKKLFLKKNLKKNFSSALLLKKDYSTINLVLEKAGKTPFACTILCLLFLEWLFVNLILIEKISTLSYEQEKNFIISESRIQTELRTLTPTLSFILTKANATD